MTLKRDEEPMQHNYVVLEAHIRDVVLASPELLKAIRNDKRSGRYGQFPSKEVESLIGKRFKGIATPRMVGEAVFAVVKETYDRKPPLRYRVRRAWDAIRERIHPTPPHDFRGGNDRFGQ